MTGYRALLWDNDGVLVDTERHYFAACRKALAALEIELTEALFHDHWMASSIGMRALVGAHGLTQDQVAQLQRDRDQDYEARLASEPLTIDGVEHVLRALRPQFAMGIVTGSRRSHFEAMHRRTGLLSLFDFSVTEDDCPRTKPHPDPYLAAIARTGVPAAACLAIEDAPRGLAAARAAGLDCWVIRTPLTARADLSAATRVLDRVTDVAALLLGDAAPGCA